MTAPDTSRLWQRVEGWLQHATEDARIARGCLQLDPPSLGGAAYHCQQAAEKLLKGFLVRAGIDFRKTHDLDTLGLAVLAHFPSVAALLTPLRDWTMWSVAYRYPGEAEPEPEPSTEELSQALDLISRLAAALRSFAPPFVAPGSAGVDSG
jgi:HEPN domain-containing protein